MLRDGLRAHQLVRAALVVPRAVAVEGLPGMRPGGGVGVAAQQVDACSEICC